MSEMSIKQYKQRYQPVILKAQRKFRRMLKHNPTALELIEAQSTGGQFSLKGKSDYGEILAEVTRARNFLSSNLRVPEKFVRDAKERGAEYADMFERGIPNAIKRTMPDYDEETAKLMYRVYRKVTEDAPLREKTNNYWDSEEFLGALYSIALEDKYDEEFLTHVAQTIIDRTGAEQRREEFANDIPVFSEFTNDRGGKLWGK